MGSARGMAHRWVDVQGLRLHCVEAGAGPLVVLLHGFPEFWYAWRH
jgi:epoxide hydrolase 4